MELDLTQLEAGKILGVTESSVYNWETGRDNPQLYLVPEIIRFLGHIPDLFSTKTVGQKIVAYRWIHGLSQKMLASILDIDPSTLGRYERDEIFPQGRLKTKIELFLTETSKSLQVGI